MVKRVATPAEHHLITSSPFIRSQLALETLKQYSHTRLIDLKLTTKNLKAGLDFVDHYKARSARSKLSTMILNHIVKEIPFVADRELVNPNYILKPSGYDTFKLQTVVDPGVSRFVRKLNYLAKKYELPVQLQCNDYGTGTYEIGIITNPNSRSTITYYRIIHFLPDIIKALKTLSRKASFTDENAKTHNRYRTPSSVIARSSKSSGRTKAKTGPSATPAPVVRAAQRYNY